MILSFASRGEAREAKRLPMGGRFSNGTGAAPETQSVCTRREHERSAGLAAQHRNREALELHLIALGVARPEQLADALLQEVAR